MAAPPFDPEELQHHVGGLRRLARAVLRDEAAAEDVAQQAVVRALEHSGEGHARWPWLARVARNLAIDRLRADRRRAARERRHGEDGRADRAQAEAGPADRVARAEAHREAVDVLLALPDPYRTALLMRYLEERPPKDIAAELDVAEATVRSHCKRGLEMVRARMHKRHGEDWRARLALLLPPAAGAVPATASPAPPWATAALLGGIVTVIAAHALWAPAPERGPVRGTGIYDQYVDQMQRALQQLGYASDPARADGADDSGDGERR